ncbi:MAG: hypothetical protein ACOCUF_02935 [Patescibacteria group bacterium]
MRSKTLFSVAVLVGLVLFFSSAQAGFDEILLEQRAKEVFGAKMDWQEEDMFKLDFYQKDGKRLVSIVDPGSDFCVPDMQHLLDSLERDGWDYDIYLVITKGEKENPQPRPSLEDNLHGDWGVSGFWEEFPEGWGAEVFVSGNGYKWKIVKKEGDTMYSYDSVVKSYVPSEEDLDDLWGNNSGEFHLWREFSNENSGNTKTRRVFQFK